MPRRTNLAKWDLRLQHVISDKIRLALEPIELEDWLRRNDMQIARVHVEPTEGSDVETKIRITTDYGPRLFTVRVRELR